MAMAEGVKEGLLVRSVISGMRPGVAFSIELFKDNAGVIAVTANPLSSGKSKHSDVRWHFIRDLVNTKPITVTHVESG